MQLPGMKGPLEPNQMLGRNHRKLGATPGVGVHPKSGEGQGSRLPLLSATGGEASFLQLGF